MNPLATYKPGRASLVGSDIGTMLLSSTEHLALACPRGSVYLYGCGKPGNDMGDPKNITDKTFEEAAKASKQSPREGSPPSRPRRAKKEFPI
jgi:hypothetical protein